jgi:hypothetical protein
MSDLILIPICIITGFVISGLKFIPENSHKFLNTIIIYVFLPALTIYYIPQLNLSTELIFPAMAIWIIFFFAFLIFVILEKIIKWERKTTGALILTAGLANTSFLGFPVLLAMFGEEGLKIGVIMDQAGSFLVLSTLGITVASLYSDGSYSTKKIALDLLKYPSFTAFIVSVLMLLLGIRHNDISLAVFGKLGAPTIILALISVGMQMKIKTEHLQIKELICGLSCKMIFAPAAVFFLYSFFMNTVSLTFKVSVIESAMPPMVMGSVLASQSGLNPRLANQMVVAGLFLSVITLPLWYRLVM